MEGLKTAVIKETKWEDDHLLSYAGLLLWMIGFIKVSCSAFPSLSKNCWSYLLLAIFVCFLLIQLLKTKYCKWVLSAALVLVLIAAVLQKSAFTDGFAALGNDIRNYITGKTGKIYLSYPVSKDYGKHLVSVIGLCFFLLFMEYCFTKGKLAPFYGLTIGCFLGCILTFFEINEGMLLLAAGLLLLITGKEYRNKQLGRLCGTIVFMLAVIGIAAAVAFPACYKAEDKLSFQKEINQLKASVHKQIYDSGADAMPEGNLINVGVFEKSDETALLIKMQKPQKLYLRGKIGEIYTGIAWKDLDEETFRESESLFYWLHEKEFYGQTMIESVGKLMEEQPEKQILRITNKSACKEHLYLPYALADSQILSKDRISFDKTDQITDEIEAACCVGSVPQWYQMAIWLSEHQNEPEVKEYLKKEESYREFVYKNDLQLTNTVVGTMEKLFHGKDQEKTLSEILDLVRETLEQELTYEEYIITSNGKNDFAKYTLEQSKRGYSVHYATIATLMLRYLGVPARYVEGYFLPAEEAEKYSEDQEICLTEGHAHAWTEYYLDGIGWIPFEVTPGYIDEEEWEAFSNVIADEKGENIGKGYAQSTLTYTPPKQSEADSSDLKSSFRFEIKKLPLLFVIFVIIAILFCIWRVMKRFYRLKKFKKQMREADHRTYVIELYGYAKMLSKRYSSEDETEDLFAEKINEEARFSRKEISEEQRIWMKQYADEVIKICKKNGSFWKRIKDRYILWLY